MCQYLKTPATSGTSAFSISEFLNVDPNAQYTSISFPNTDTNQNFRILDQGIVHLDGSPIVGGKSVKIVTDTVNCSFHQTYSGAASTTITSNMIFFVCVVDSVQTTDSFVIPSFRCWYVDN